MFDSLSEKLQETLTDVRQRGTLAEDDVDKVMREIRLALLEADVNFRVVKSFTASVKERCLTEEVIGHLNPGQQVIKIVDEELTTLMGGAGAGITFSPRPPTVILMAGLQGSGKTTPTAKLARPLHAPHGGRGGGAGRDDYSPAARTRPDAGPPRADHGAGLPAPACDGHRRAAVDQLVTVGAQAGAPVYEQ